jgi:hypothetical protein
MDPAAPQLLPQVSVLEVGAASAALSASYLFTRRWSGALGIGFSVGGGLRGSDAYLPFRYGPFAAASVSYQLTQADGLTSSLSGGLDILPKRHTRFQTITLLESWVHKFDPLTVGTIGAGATYLQGKAKGSPTTRAVNAAGLAGLTRAFKLDGGAVLGLGVNATLNSAYNPVLGNVTQGLSGGLGATWARKRLALNAGVQGSHSLPFDDPQAFRSYGASGGATYQLSEPIALSAGAYWSHQVLPPSVVLSTTDPNRWGATLGVVVVAPPIKF